MDILAHALWTHAVHRGASKAKNFKLSKKDIWIAIFFGLAPDLFSFGPYFIREISYHGLKIFGGGPPDPSTIPAYIHNSYSFTHSLVIFLVVFGLIWLIRKNPYWLMFGWGLHIATDIFSHSTSFFPTPFLFPLSNYHVNGYSWGHPLFMAINYSLLVIVYVGIRLWSKRKAQFAPN